MMLASVVQYNQTQQTLENICQCYSQPYHVISNIPAHENKQTGGWNNIILCPVHASKQLIISTAVIPVLQAYNGRNDYTAVSGIVYKILVFPCI